MKRILITLTAVVIAAALSLGVSPASAQYLEGTGGEGIEQAGGGQGAAAGGELSRTGSSNVLPLVGIGGAALLLGGAFIYGARKPSEA